MVVYYQPGGGGAVGWASLNGLNGDGQTIMGVNLPHIIIKPAQKDVGFGTADLNTFYMFHFNLCYVFCDIRETVYFLDFLLL